MKKIKHIYYLLLVLYSVLLIGCAQKAPLGGGPRDEVPPQIDLEISSPNYVTNFVKQEIELNFDEFVDLKNASKQIVISPPLQYPPIIKNRLKRIRINFDEREELKENATYIINFGKSIRDFTEGNELINYAYVFSTGDYIDSLSMSGEVIDVVTSKPVEDALVMLYVDNRDSVVYEERPFYFARTDKTGKFRLKNLRADSFKIVAIKDEDLNYLYNPLNEQIGFLDSLIHLSQDSITDLSIELWTERTETLYTSYDVDAKGKLILQFDGDVLPDDITVLDSVTSYVEQTTKDKSPLFLWYKPTGRSRMSWTANTRNGLDTISARINLRTTDSLDGEFLLNGWDYDKKTGLHPLEPLKFRSSYPISIIDTSFISILDTSAQRLITYNIDSTSLPNTQLTINADWPEEKQLLMTLLPGAMTDFFGNGNDTITQYIKIGTPSSFGSIALSLKNFDSTSYVIQLMKDKTIIEERIKTPEIEELKFERMVPNTYNITIIADDNGNGKWDPGNYLQHKQAERIYTATLEPLKESWYLESDLNLEEIKQEQATRQSQERQEKSSENRPAGRGK